MHVYHNSRAGAKQSTCAPREQCFRGRQVWQSVRLGLLQASRLESMQLRCSCAPCMHYAAHDRVTKRLRSGGPLCGLGWHSSLFGAARSGSEGFWFDICLHKTCIRSIFVACWVANATLCHTLLPRGRFKSRKGTWLGSPVDSPYVCFAAR